MNPRYEPYEVIPHVRIRAGGRSQERSLPRVILIRRTPTMKLIKIAAVAGAAMLVAAAANAQGVDFSKVEITTVDLGNKTYMLVGQGGNITVAVGTDGIIVVDSQYAPLYDKIKAAIAKISLLPIKY